jgi:hypothetical protein
MFLYRPVGLEELLLVFSSGMRAFPPRLPEQPIFYPVLNQRYAAQIAGDWNTRSGSYAGYVTRFSVDERYANSIKVRRVGSSLHSELWVSAEELNEFNAHIKNRIEVVQAFFGDNFKGMTPESFALKGKLAVAQFVILDGMFQYNLMDFHGEIAANKSCVFVHFPYWKTRDFSEEGISASRCTELLNAIRRVWSDVSPEVSLPDL